MLGPTLIVAENPFECLDYYDNLLKGENLTKLLKDYDKSQGLYTKKLESIERERKSAGLISKKERDITALQQQQATELPDINFLPRKQINTKSHIAYYAPGLSQIQKDKIRQPLDLAETPLDAHVTSDLLLALFAGVGILYESSEIDSLYERAIIEITK